MSNQNQPTAEQQVLLLKSRLFDANEQLQSMDSQIKLLSQGLQRLVDVAEIAPDENGQIQLEPAIEHLANILANHIADMKEADEVIAKG